MGPVKEKVYLSKIETIIYTLNTGKKPENKERGRLALSMLCLFVGQYLPIVAEYEAFMETLPQKHRISLDGDIASNQCKPWLIFLKSLSIIYKKNTLVFQD